MQRILNEEEANESHPDFSHCLDRRSRSSNSSASTRPAYASPARLVVLIAVDQFSASLFDQWRGDGLGPRVLVVMTGDHGGSDFVERLALRGFANARRIDSKAFLTAVNDELKSKFSLTVDPLVTPDFTQYYAVGGKKLALGEPLRTNVIEAALAILNGRQEVEVAFSLRELLSHKEKRSAQSDYSLRDRYAQSAMDGRSGDIIVAFKSGIATGPALPTGLLMGHSGPYRNDTAVPIVFWWQGMKGQTRILPVDTTMIAPTLANIIDAKPPADLDGTCFDLGFPGAPKCAR